MFLLFYSSVDFFIFSLKFLLIWSFWNFPYCNIKQSKPIFTKHITKITSILQSLSRSCDQFVQTVETHTLAESCFIPVYSMLAISLAQVDYLYLKDTIQAKKNKSIIYYYIFNIKKYKSMYMLSNCIKTTIKNYITNLHA